MSPHPATRLCRYHTQVCVVVAVDTESHFVSADESCLFMQGQWESYLSFILPAWALRCRLRASLDWIFLSFRGEHRDIQSKYHGCVLLQFGSRS